MKPGSNSALIALGVILLMAPCTSSFAGDDAEGGFEATSPWSEGVSVEQRETARTLFEEGNVLLKDALFARAADKYREALSYWEHPRIYYNLTLALINLDRPIELYQAIDKALAYGPDALDPDKYEQAKLYRKQYEKQIARVEITCDEPGAEVKLDGKLLFKGPGTREPWVLIGEHTVVASKPGYVTRTRSLLLTSGQRKQIQLNLIALDQTTREVRHWAWWKPWLVVTGGALVAGAGGVIHWGAFRDYRRYDSLVDENCKPDLGCTLEQSAAYRPLRERAVNGQRVAIGAYAFGGVVLGVGIALSYYNRERTIRVDLDDDDAGPVSIWPLLAPDTAGVNATIRF